MTPFELKGAERVFARKPQDCEKISHVLEVIGNISLLEQHIQLAWQKVLNRHPKMRILQSKKSFFSGEICSFVTLEKASKCLRVIHSQNPNEWENIVKFECNTRVFDRFQEFPFWLYLCVEDKDKSPCTTARLILFSDHYMSDGHSGTVVLNEILEIVTDSSRLEAKEEEEPEPLYPSLYDQCFPDAKKSFKLKILSAIVCYLIPLILSILHYLYKPFMPLKVIKDPIEQPQMLTCNSTKEALKNLLIKCKQENVTVGNALITAFVLAFGATKESITNERLPKIKASLDIPHNMRQRFDKHHSVDKNAVGMYASPGPLNFLSSKGIETNISFWDTVRHFQKEMQTLSKSNPFMFLLPNMAAHECATSSVMMKPSKCTSDLRLSNLGRYPFTKEYPVKGTTKSKLVVTNLLFTSWAMHSTTVGMFISSVENLTFSCIHRLDDQIAEEFLQRLLYIVENINTIDKDTSVREILDLIKDPYPTISITKPFASPVAA
jgi:hypothetical protein